MAYNQKIMRMKELIEKLTEADIAYYKNDNPIMTDREYDLLFDELAKLETETSLTLSGSPTQKVSGEILESLTPVTHSKPMLSADKTKSVDDLIKFAKGRDVLLSWKLDGLTIVIRYKGGKLEQAITRGTEGIVGEDVTHTVKTFLNVPLTIPEKSEFEVRGEGVVSYKNFNEINLGLDEPYTLPRAFASASTRKLNSNESKERKLEFFAFDIVSENNMPSTKTDEFEFMERNGFQTVPHVYLNADSTADIIKAAVERFEPKLYGYPVDGLIMEYDDIAYGRSLGTTAKFPRDSFAFKWEDEIKETHLLEIEWSPSRTGLINPVAIFEPVELEGTTVSRASVHNLSILKGLELGIGDVIRVYKANMIIPQIEENLTRSSKLEIPSVCPVCGGATEIRSANGIETLNCTNPECQAKKIKSFTLFVSRDAMNIEGLSEATLEKFIGMGFIHEFADIFRLKEHRESIQELEGFGEKSCENLLKNIETARNTTLVRLIYSLGIPGIGLANAKMLCRAFSWDWEKLKNSTLEELTAVDGIGEILAKGIIAYFQDKKMLEAFSHLLSEVHLEEVQVENTEQVLAGKTFVITGSVTHFVNRNEMKAYIEERGGKVTGSVTSKTDYLINNDSTSGSSKNKKAKELGIPILTEDDFLKIAGDVNEEN